MANLQRFSELEEQRAINRRLQAQLVRAKTKTEDLVEATRQAAFDAAYSLGDWGPMQPPERDRRTKRNEWAFWHLTDWQGAKRTPSYNLAVMEQRVLRFTDIAKEITIIQRADHPIKSVLIAFGGDMVEGLFQFPTQPFEVDATIFEQYVQVSRLIVQVVRQALAIYDEVSVIAEWGNHGRIGSKRDNVPRYDNFDRMCYELARQLLAGEPRLTWPENGANDIQHVEIGNYRALLIHGDEVGRSGYVSRNQFINHANRWRSGAHKWDFRDIYVGHYHVHAEEPLANGQGRIFWTGSTESDNRYANDMLAASSEPSQRLHFIQPEKGYVTAQYQIYLGEAAGL